MGGAVLRRRKKDGTFAKERYCWNAPCQRCGKTFRVSSKHRKFCSMECYEKCDRYVDLMGYVVVKKPGHQHATTNGWVREHIVIACNTIGRSLEKHECVHHIDGNKQNNKPENLVVVHRALHARIHHSNPRNRKYGEENTETTCASTRSSASSRPLGSPPWSFLTGGCFRRGLRRIRRPDGQDAASCQRAKTLRAGDEVEISIKWPEETRKET